MKRIILVCIMVFIGLLQFAGADPVIVLNKEVAEEALDADTIQKIYLGKKSRWDNGDKIVATALNDGAVHELFLGNFVKKSPEQFTSFWKKMFFTGNGIPPKAFATEKELVDYVSSTKGAIGYVDSATPADAVKVINLQ